MTRTEARRWLAVARRAPGYAPPVAAVVYYVDPRGRHFVRWWGIDASGRTEGEALRRLVDKVAARLDRDAMVAHRKLMRAGEAYTRLSGAASDLRSRRAK